MTQSGLFAKEQFRIRRLQVFNWGTFSGMHDIPISDRGFLFVGGSGAGKTTLLDAFSAMLIPPRWIDFNAAAREFEHRGRDRNLVSYVRGAWAEQKDSDSGEIATRYLRTDTTWAALALTYKNESGNTVVLVQVFWLRGKANTNADVRRLYMIFERPFDLQELEDFGKSDFDKRKLKQSFPDSKHYDEFRPYCDNFCRLLGINSDNALKLLHKTQSAKNLGDLNTFLRDFMLDKPETFDVADRLVNEFDELNAAHKSVVTAREQIEMLVPARDKHDQMESFKTQKSSLDELQAGIDIYRETRRIEFLKDRITSLSIEATGHEGEITQRQGILDNHANVLKDLENQHRDSGGEKIEQWENEKKTLESQREERSRKRALAENACKELGWTFAQTPLGFAEIVGLARTEIEGWENRSKTIRDEQLKLEVEKKEAESEFAIAVKEVKALERQPSNIPADMLELRENIAREIGVSHEVLPFIGELIEVKQDETSWQGAIERVLRSFALSLLVDERNYQSLSNYINNTHLGRRLVYYRTSHVESRSDKSVNTDSLVLKLNIKEGNYADWLKAELRQRFDYACVDSVNAFRTVDRAITKEGQVKHSKSRHEKDDRRAVNDRRSFVLGFDNGEKLALYQTQAHELAVKISELGERIDLLSNQEKASRSRDMHCQTLINMQWQEIDVVLLIERIATIEKSIREKRDGNKELKELASRIDTQKALVRQSENDLQESIIAFRETQNKIDSAKEQLEKLQNDPSIVPLTPHQKEGLDARYAQITEGANLDNLDRNTTTIVQSLSKEIEKISGSIATHEKQIESIFTNFKRTWPMDASDFDTTLASASDFFAKLARLETDGLPAHEQRFFELLQNQSNQNLADLSHRLTEARKAIIERMEYVNESLKQAPFNETANMRTFLRIDASDRQLLEVREFKQNIQQALSHAWSDDYSNRELTETRFVALRKIVQQLSAPDPEQKRWRDNVLDVRLHVEFIGREIAEDGTEVEVYRSGAGKSGGQRQKLATTCLAAALRYQLGGDELATHATNEQGVPMYAPVILDEAFDKADNEFTTLAMNIFKNFGFQMIVATPLKSVMTLEPFIGGACFVNINDRRVSTVLLIEYDDERQRLNLPEHGGSEHGGASVTA